MAYPQYNDSKPAGQQQYYNQGPQPGRQPGGYNDQYNDQYHDQYNDQYGYDQAQYEQWDNGYYDQQRQQQGGGWGNAEAQAQQQGGYPNTNGQMRHPPQSRGPPPGRGPPPRDQYGQDGYEEQTYHQAQEQGAGAWPLPPANEPAVQERSQRSERRPPNRQQGQSSSRPPRSERALMAPVTLQLPQDNPFPVFPTAKVKAKARPPAGTIEGAMSSMSIEQRDEPQGRPRGPPQGHPQGRGRGPVSPPQNRGPSGRGGGPASPPQNRGPPSERGRGYSNPDMHRQDSGHGEGSRRGQQPPLRVNPQQRPPPMDLEGVQAAPPRRFDPASPSQRTFGPNTQRSVTMPHNTSASASVRSYDSQQQYQEPGPVAGYHGPASPSYIPPRPSTASGVKNDSYGRQPQFQQQPPVPQAPPKPQAPPREPQYQQYHAQGGHGELDNLYDDYYGDDASAHDITKVDSEEMPNFDAIPEANTRQRRGYSIEDHLSPVSSAPAMQGMAGIAVTTDGPTYASTTAGPAHTAYAPQNDFYQQAARSRSQPDLHEQYSQADGGYEMAGDAPAVPQLPMANHAPVGLPSGPRGRGPPPRGMTMDSGSQRGVPNPGYESGPPIGQAPMRSMTMGAEPQRAPSNPGYGFGQQPGQQPPSRSMTMGSEAQRAPSNPAYTQAGHQQNFDPRYRQQQPPMHRGYSDQSTYSEPGPHVMRNGSMTAGTPVPRPGTAAPAPGRMPVDPVSRRPGTAQPINPDALPAHPVPVRPGLMQQNQEQAPVSQAMRPPPVRQYHTEPTPVVGYGNQPPSSLPPQRRPSVVHPVTHDELNRLRNAWKASPSDSATGLTLVKKLVEAATVLADEGGTADTRSRNKNREKFINEALKTVKKLVSGGSPDAMFYLADAYGSGKLGLQVDTKEAFTLYQSAGKAGHAASAYRTAVCCEMGHEEGGGTKKDPLKAVQWYRRSAALGDTAAMYKTGMILLKGLLGQQKNLGEAINMLKRAADRADEANPHALHELALLYESQTGNERIIRDEKYASQLFMQAAELGYKFSQFRLGQAYEYGILGYPIDARSSIAWYTRAASQEEHQAELALSGWYLTGSQGILEQSDTEAYLWARKAACAEPPLPKALFAMGYFTEVGIGCPRSLEEAKRWYGRAATYKFPKAQERLEELKKGGAKVQRSRERLSRTNQKQHDENCVVM